MHMMCLRHLVRYISDAVEVSAVAMVDAVVFLIASVRGFPSSHHDYYADLVFHADDFESYIPWTLRVLSTCVLAAEIAVCGGEPVPPGWPCLLLCLNSCQ